MASLRLAISLVLAALTLAAVPNASAIVDGELDTEHDYVVMLRLQVEFAPRPGVWANTNSFCSGTLVSPDVVVTAAHCSLIPPGAPFPITRVRYGVYQGESALSAPSASTTGRFVTHPGFDPAAGPQLGNTDLGVVVLDAPLEGPYAHLPKEGWVGQHFEKSKQLVIVGYGLTARPPPTVGLGTRRSVQARAAVVGDAANFLVLPVPDKEKYGTACRADSGGAGLVGDTLVAVTSFGDTSCGGPSYSFRVDTPTARDFLGRYVDLR